MYHSPIGGFDFASLRSRNCDYHASTSPTKKPRASNGKLWLISHFFYVDKNTNIYSPVDRNSNSPQEKTNKRQIVLTGSNHLSATANENKSNAQMVGASESDSPWCLSTNKLSQFSLLEFWPFSLVSIINNGHWYWWQTPITTKQPLNRSPCPI